MEPQRSRTPLPSPRAVLAIGALGFVWIALAGLLVLQLDAEAQAETSTPSPTTAPPPLRSDLASLSPEVTLTERAPLAEPPPSPPTDHPSLQSAYDEPVLDELLALLNAVLPGLERPDAVPSPRLQGYVSNLVQRMNNQGQPFAARIAAPDPEEARYLAVRMHILLIEAGLQPWLLEVSGKAGASGVSVERTSLL